MVTRWGQAVAVIARDAASSSDSIVVARAGHEALIAIPLPAGILAGFPAAALWSHKFRWSPDGRKILVSWRGASVVDLDRGLVESISSTPIAADWAPGSDGVYYLEIKSPDAPPTRTVGSLYFRSLTGATTPMLAPAKLAACGLSVLPGLAAASVTLSPGGRRLAVVVGVAGKSTNTCLLDVAPDATVSHRRSRPIDASDDVFHALEWSPDETHLAAFTTLHGLTTPNVSTITMSVKVLDVKVGTWAGVEAFQVNRVDVPTLGTKLLSWAQ